MGSYFDIKIYNSVNKKTETIKIESGVTFENKNFRYTMKDDGKLSIFNKKTNTTADSSEIKVTDYMMRTIKSVADNNSESDDCTVLSINDIKSATEKGDITALDTDLNKNLRSSYKALNIEIPEQRNSFSVYISNGNEIYSSEVSFQFPKENNTNPVSYPAGPFTAFTDFPPDPYDVMPIMPFPGFNPYAFCVTLGNNLPFESYGIDKTSEVPDQAHNDDAQYSNNGTAGIEANKNLKAGDKCVEIIKKYEGRKLKTYKCSADKNTIGYGHTKGVTPGQTITQAQAEKFLVQDLKAYEKIVKDSVKVELSQNQFDALVSFAYNVGGGNFRNSTLLKRLNNGNFESAANQFSRWVYSNHKKQGGLVKRRAAEKELFLS